MNAKMTAEEQATVKAYLMDRNAQNWGLWPAIETWPVPASLGAWTASQYKARGGQATVIKFDNAVELASGRVTKHVGVGATRRLGFQVAGL
jgi:hypothetical protein